MDNIRAVIQNSFGSITLDGSANGSGQFHITKFEGFESSDIQIKKNDNAVGNGSLVSSVRIDSRTITVEATYDERSGMKKAEMEQFLIGFFNPLETSRVTINKNGYIRYLDFIVSSFTTGFENAHKKLKFQVVGDAADPFMKDSEEFAEDVASKTPMIIAPFYFTSSGIVASVRNFRSVFELVNSGHVETGIDLVIKASGEVVNPVFTNLDTGEYLKVNKTLVSGDTLEISTKRLNSFIRLNGTNISRYKDRGSKYFQLQPGNNTVTFSADSGYTLMSVFPKYRSEYYGI